MLVSFHVMPSLAAETNHFKEQLAAGSPEIDWQLADNANDAEVVFCGLEEEVLSQNKYLYVPGSAFDTLSEYLDAKITRGELVLPTEAGIKVFQQRLAEEQDNFAKLKRNNPLFLHSSRLPEESEISSKLNMFAFAVHPAAMERFVPSVKRVFDRRAVRSLQRILPEYRPLKCGVLDEDILALYPKLPSSGTELNGLISSVSDHLEKLGVVPAPSDMSFSQLNLGIPFPGGANREAAKLTKPSATYEKCAEHVAWIMLLGAARQLNKVGLEAFKGENTRVGVKKANYQGVPLSTSSHAMRQTAWAVMQQSEEGIFHFKKYSFPTGVGFRRQSNSGKRRVSFVLGANPGQVLRSSVYDGGQLKGKTVAKYKATPGKVGEPEMVKDGGEIGSRVRIVENVWSPQNDALLPVPSYIRKYKEEAYKFLFQQDPEIMRRFVPGSAEFYQYWSDAYAHEPWVREAALERGFSSFDELHRKMVSLGEYIIAGDVENFDGYTTWELLEPFLKHLVSPEVLSMSKKLWDADKIGVYTDVSGQITYYYVSCVPEKWMDPDMVREVERTADLMSHVASGLGITAQAGRGVVPTVMAEIALIAFSADNPKFESRLFSLPSSENSYCSGLNAMMNSAGDDHHLSSLAIWLMTGIEPKVAQSKFLAAMENYSTLKISREIPAMNAGYLFQERNDGTVEAVSLSPGRFWSNTVNPEHPRSAIGLWHSTDQYVRSALDTPLEQTMRDLANLIVCELYGFSSLEELERIAMLEEEYLQNHAGDFSPAERIAALLSIPVNKLEWAIELEDLIEMGVPSDLINEYRRPIPEDLTVDPTRFLNIETITKISNTLKG